MWRSIALFVAVIGAPNQSAAECPLSFRLVHPRGGPYTAAEQAAGKINPPGFRVMSYAGRELLVSDTVAISGNQIERISVARPDHFDPEIPDSSYLGRVRIEFTDEGETIAHRVALLHPNQQVAIMAGGSVISSPLISGTLREKGDWFLSTREPDLWVPFVAACTR